MVTTLAHSESLAAFLRLYPNVVILTGAGVSAGSGIPTYRDSQGRWLYREPIQHRDFLKDEMTRKRYWSRSLVGWPHVRDAAPNEIHRILAELEADGRVELLITQNVDRLHQRAGSQKVIDLHGRLDRVRCLDCDNLEERETVQGWLLEHNDSEETTNQQLRPDGDSDVPDEHLQRFRLPPCPACSGVFMPDVVFFGGTVPAARVASCREAIDRADALLVVGSSLQVYSGYRFCRHAHDNGKPIAIINPGITRADAIADLRIKADAGETLAGLTATHRH